MGLEHVERIKPGFRFGVTGISARPQHIVGETLIEETEHLLVTDSLPVFGSDLGGHPVSFAAPRLNKMPTKPRAPTAAEREASLIAKTELQLQGMPKRIKKTSGRRNGT
jgi:hypothetical protein